MKVGVILIVSLALSACSTFNPIPEGYTGPTAVIKDSFSEKSASNAHYFELEKVNENRISDSFGATRQKYYGQGMYFEPVMVEHEVLPERQSFTISGFVFYPTDAQLLFSNNLSVEGIVTFTPKAGETYTVSGTVIDDVSEVWLQDSSGNVIGDKFSKMHAKQ